MLNRANRNSLCSKSSQSLSSKRNSSWAIRRRSSGGVRRDASASPFGIPAHRHQRARAANESGLTRPLARLEDSNAEGVLAAGHDRTRLDGRSVPYLSTDRR